MNKNVGVYQKGNYFVESSKLDGYKAVRYDYKYKGHQCFRYVLIEKVSGKTDNFYKKKAKVKILELTNNGELFRNAKKQIPFWTKTKIIIAATTGALVVGTGVATGVVIANNAGSPLLYRLDFKGGNIGHNSANHNYANAEIIGEGKQVLGAHKDSGILKFTTSEHNTNYLSIPTNVLNNKTTTIAMWVKMPTSFADFAEGAPLFGITWENGYFYTSPFDNASWKGYSLNTNANGYEQNLTHVSGSEKIKGREVPLEGILQPVSNAWHLIGFTFSENNLTVYQNGQERLSYSGNYGLSDKNIREFKIGSATQSSAKDFNASIADVRIYNKELEEKDYIKEYKLNYRDFQTLNLDFNNNLNDNVRGFNGHVKQEALDNNRVTFEHDGGRDYVYLHGGNETESDIRSGFFLPKESLHGHHDLTISTDVYFEPRVGEAWQYLRLFDFSKTNGDRFLSFYYTLYDTNRMRLEFIPDVDKESSTPWVTVPDFIMPIKKWINFTFILSKESIKILVDGKLIASRDDLGYNSSLFTDYENCDFAIGRPVHWGDHALECRIDNLQMFACSLSDSEIQNLMGHYINENDNVAVSQAIANFNIEQITRDGGGQIYPVSYLSDGVKVSTFSYDNYIIDNQGYIIYRDEPQSVNLNVTFSRGDANVEKKYKVVVPARKGIDTPAKNNDLKDAYYAEDSYQQKMQEENLKWMVSLNNDKLLHSYRLIAGLDAPGESYGSWIREGCGGEGQFQGEYIGALARATNYHDESGENLLHQAREKLEYLLTEIRRCQVNYADPSNPWGDPDQKGYLNAFTHLCFYGMEHGLCSHVGHSAVGQIRKEDGFNVPYNITIWVPFYMYHKQLMMCYDTYTYANMGDETKTNEIRNLAKTMLIEAADWLKREVFKMTPDERECALRVEWGGIAEAMYLTYRLTKNTDYLKVAHFFEESGLIDDLYNNSNVFSGIHTNTTLPKLLSCCAAYEVLGDTYYLQAAENAWDMIANHMTVANGSVSALAEHFQKPDVVSQQRFGEETCCSYNMLRLTDYLYKFTKDPKYAHYFEKVFYNHIMSSIDMVGSTYMSDDGLNYVKEQGVKKAGKVYVTSTDFGHHKVYSSAEDSFWCCVATGTETFSKLTYGNFYNTNEGDVYVNMYNNISLRTGDNTGLSISGIRNGTNDKGSEYVEIKASINSSIDLNKVHFIRPYWVANDPVMTLNDKSHEYQLDEKGYMVTNGTLAAGDTLKITLPMKLSAVEQLGYQGTSERPYSYALFYGPYILTPDLGSYPLTNTSDPKSGDIYIHDNNGSDQSGQVSYDTRVTSDRKTQDIKFNGTLDSVVTKKLNDAEITDTYAHHSGLEFAFTTTNQDILTFRPFMDICYERYSMYMYYDQALVL